MACRPVVSLLAPEADKVGGAPSVGVPCNAAMAPGQDAAPVAPGPRTAVGGGPRLRTGGRTPVHRMRTARLAALLVGLAMVAAACGGGGDEGGGGGGSAQIQPGGTLNYASDQEPTGFKNSTSKDHGPSVHSVVINMFPQAFHAQPDFTVKMDDAFLDSAEQTSENPQTIVY